MAARLQGGLADVLNSGIGSKNDLAIDIAPDLWTVTVDPTEFETALVNPVINARDAMPAGSTVTISASNDAILNQVMISVSDPGFGIPDDVRPKIFDPFFTTKPFGKGTGLSGSSSYLSGGPRAPSRSLAIP